MRTELCGYTGRETHHPETFVERIAWALCAQEQKGSEGYLNDDELAGLEALLAKLGRMCGSVKAEADYLGLPPPAVRRYIDPLKQLAKMERWRRDEPNPLHAMHLTAAYWTDYMGKAQAVWSVMLEDARIAAVVAEREPAEPTP